MLVLLEVTVHTAEDDSRLAPSDLQFLRTAIHSSRCRFPWAVFQGACEFCHFCGAHCVFAKLEIRLTSCSLKGLTRMIPVRRAACGRQIPVLVFYRCCYLSNGVGRYIDGVLCNWLAHPIDRNKANVRSGLLTGWTIVIGSCTLRCLLEEIFSAWILLL